MEIIPASLDTLHGCQGSIKLCQGSMELCQWSMELCQGSMELCQWSMELCQGSMELHNTHPGGRACNPRLCQLSLYLPQHAGHKPGSIRRIEVVRVHIPLSTPVLETCMWFALGCMEFAWVCMHTWSLPACMELHAGQDLTLSTTPGTS
jgi:hypothetical protein